MASESPYPLTECQDISDAFLSLHKKDGFETLPPSSLLHPSVPMSFVMSAGLIQVENNLKNILEETGGKFAFTQPCFRHFDVKQVGTDTTHLSLFHMSAAFHIGCSNRETILPRLWHFLTVELQLDSKRLWITYLDDEEFGCDQNTLECWLGAGVERTNLIGLDQEHCFWRQRSTGQIASDGKKCGPHTEIFIERGGFSCGSKCTPGNPGECICGRFVEVSNSLFIENYISDEGKLIPAATVFSECVIGIERLAMVLQNLQNVHQLQHFEKMQKELSLFLVPGRTTLAQENSMRVVLDHIYAFVTLVNDGAPKPEHGGRSNIMRKLARAVATELLRWNLPVEKVLHALLIENSGKSYHYILLEWEKFNKTRKKVLAKLEFEFIKDPKQRECWKAFSKIGVPDVLLKKHQSDLNRQLSTESGTYKPIPTLLKNSVCHD